MRKVIGIGETVLDIIFKNGKPTEPHNLLKTQKFASVMRVEKFNLPTLQ